MRLNPFFIRSAVEILVERGLVPSGTVLIPSSSGLRLKLRTPRGPTRPKGLSPFFIRSAVEMPPRVEVGPLDES